MAGCKWRPSPSYSLNTVVLVVLGDVLPFSFICYTLPHYTASVKTHSFPFPERRWEHFQ